MDFVWKLCGNTYAVHVTLALVSVATLNLALPAPPGFYLNSLPSWRNTHTCTCFLYAALGFTSFKEGGGVPNCVTVLFNVEWSVLLFLHHLSVASSRGAMRGHCPLPIRGSAPTCPPEEKWQKSAIFGKCLDFCPPRKCILHSQCPHTKNFWCRHCYKPHSSSPIEKGYNTIWNFCMV